MLWGLFLLNSIFIMLFLFICLLAYLLPVYLSMHLYSYDMDKGSNIDVNTDIDLCIEKGQFI